jgi:putative transposase
VCRLHQQLNLNIFDDMDTPPYHPLFFTATILEWKDLLKPDKYKDVIISSLQFFVKQKRTVVYAFVIMSNHIHIIWRINTGYKKQDIQRDFLKYTAQQIKEDLIKNHPKVLSHFEVNAKDRKYQLWERNSLSIELYTEAVFIQKLEYIHNNPVKAELCNLPEDYKYSSANFYEKGIDDFDFLTHFRY